MIFSSPAPQFGQCCMSMSKTPLGNRASIALRAARRRVPLPSGPPSDDCVRARPATSRRRDQVYVCRRWVDRRRSRMTAARTSTPRSCSGATVKVDRPLSLQNCRSPGMNSLRLDADLHAAPVSGQQTTRCRRPAHSKGGSKAAIRCTGSGSRPTYPLMQQESRAHLQTVLRKRRLLVALPNHLEVRPVIWPV